MRAILTLMLLFGFGGALLLADVESGPVVKEKPPALKVTCVVGDDEGKEVDYQAARGDKPTVYFFIRTDRFTRPLARVLKKVDGELGKTENASAVAVWLTDNADQTKAHLPKIAQSLDFDHTTLAMFAKDREGPENWGINGDADLTAVVVRGGKVAARFGFVSPNETVAAEVLKGLKGEEGK